jgi:hypothetical protein
MDIAAVACGGRSRSDGVGRIVVHMRIDSLRRGPQRAAPADPARGCMTMAIRSEDPWARAC